jgi:hypothetical protein
VLGGKYDFVKVLDFGLVKTLPAMNSVASPTTTGAIAGSPAFLAPEAARGIIAPSCDIYALGCVAYWLLTGELVFEGQTALDILMAHAWREPVPPSVRAGITVPGALEALIMGCLQKDPAARPKSVAVIVEQLEACPLEERWTAARAKRFFEEHRADIARVNPAILRIHELAEAAPPAPEVSAPSSKNAPNQVSASIERLQHHFTRSHIDVRELELRMLRVKKAKTDEEIEKVFADLPPLDAAGPPRGATVAQQMGEVVPLHRGGAALAMRPRDPDALAVRIVSVMSSNQRELVLADGELYKAVAVMGEVALAINPSLFTQGVADLRCVAVMGNITVLVPPGVDVEVTGVGVLGLFEHWGGRARRPGRPVLRIAGVAVMGFVKIVAGKE